MDKVTHYWYFLQLSYVYLLFLRHIFKKLWGKTDHFSSCKKKCIWYIVRPSILPFLKESAILGVVPSFTHWRVLWHRILFAYLSFLKVNKVINLLHCCLLFFCGERGQSYITENIMTTCSRGRESSKAKYFY